MLGCLHATLPPRLCGIRQIQITPLHPQSPLPLPQGHSAAAPLPRLILPPPPRLARHDPLCLPLLPRLARRPSRHHAPPLATRPQELVPRRLQRHLLPSHHHHYPHRPTHRPHAREIRLFHP